MLREARYNEANVLFRKLTNQQEFVLDEAVACAPRLSDLTMTSYGCGQGIFEIAFTHRSEVQGIGKFIGVDVNPDALLKIESKLDSNEKILDYDLMLGSTAVVGDEETSTAFGASVHALYFHAREDAVSIIKRWHEYHEVMFVVISPLNDLNVEFSNVLNAEGVGIFADDLHSILGELSIPYLHKVLPGELRIPRDLTHADLQLLVGFIRHEEYDGSRRDAVRFLEELSVDSDDEYLVLPHPVESFVIGGELEGSRAHR